MARALGALGALRVTLGALSVLSACSGSGVISPVTGTLEVRISGLPTGSAASVTVTGPGGYSRAITATTSLRDLPVGTYTVAAAAVTVAGTTWAPTPALQTAGITPGAGLAFAEVVYASTAPLVLAVQEVTAGLTNPVYLDAENRASR